MRLLGFRRRSSSAESSQDSADSAFSRLEKIQEGPLLSLPSELLECICAQLALPLEGLSHSRCSLAKRTVAMDRWRDLASLSSTCQELRRIASPYVFRYVRLPREGERRRAEVIRLLRRKDILEHVQSLVIGVSAKKAGDAASDSEEDPFEASRQPYSYDITSILDAALSTVRRLHLHRHTCDASTYTAMVTHSSLETLILDDDFVLTDGAAELAHTTAAVDCQLKQLQISTSMDYILAQQNNKLGPMMALAARSKILEYLCVRTYRSTLGSNLIPSSIWASLRILALDAGDDPIVGFADLFEGFRTYCASHTGDVVPLAEVMLESRRTSSQLFEHVVSCLAGHRQLRKLSLCVVREFTLGFLYEIQRALPRLEALHIFAFHGSQVQWPGTLEDWARGLSMFKHLLTFGWNDARIIGLARLCPATMRRFVVYDSFGTTHYRGSAWWRLDSSTVFARDQSDCETFFPVSPPPL